MVPPLGENLEALRRNVLDTMKSWGYQLVIPPNLEYLDSLLTGLGPDLNLQTFKLVDQITGKTLGFPQILHLKSRESILISIHLLGLVAIATLGLFYIPCQMVLLALEIHCKLELNYLVTRGRRVMLK